MQPKGEGHAVSPHRCRAGFSMPPISLRCRRSTTTAARRSPAGLRPARTGVRSPWRRIIPSRGVSSRRFLSCRRSISAGGSPRNLITIPKHRSLLVVATAPSYGRGALEASFASGAAKLGIRARWRIRVACISGFGRSGNSARSCGRTTYSSSSRYHDLAELAFAVLFEVLQGEGAGDDFAPGVGFAFGLFGAGVECL